LTVLTQFFARPAAPIQGAPPAAAPVQSGVFATGFAAFLQPLASTPTAAPILFQPPQAPQAPSPEAPAAPVPLPGPAPSLAAPAAPVQQVAFAEAAGAAPASRSADLRERLENLLGLDRASGEPPLPAEEAARLEDAPVVVVVAPTPLPVVITPEIVAPELTLDHAPPAAAPLAAQAAPAAGVAAEGAQPAAADQATPSPETFAAELTAALAGAAGAPVPVTADRALSLEATRKQLQSFAAPSDGDQELAEAAPPPQPAAAAPAAQPVPTPAQPPQGHGQETPPAGLEEAAPAAAAESGAAESSPTPQAARAAAPPAEAAPPAAPARPQPNTPEIARSIVSRVQDGARQFELHLHPAELGRVQVRIEIGRDNSVSAALSADDPRTLVDLARNARELERSLQQTGLQLAQNALTFDLSRRDGGAQQQSQSGRAPDGGAFAAALDGGAQAVADPAATPLSARSQVFRPLRIDLLA